MCDALRAIYEKNREERMAEARKEGMLEGKKELVLECLKKNDCKTVAEFLGMPLEKIMEIAEMKN